MKDCNENCLKIKFESLLTDSNICDVCEKVVNLTDIVLKDIKSYESIINMVMKYKQIKLI